MFTAVRWRSLVVASGSDSCLWYPGFSFQWPLLFGRTGSRVPGLQQLCHMGLVALRHVGSSQTRDWTCVPCAGRRILNRWTTREVPACSFLIGWFILAVEFCEFFIYFVNHMLDISFVNIFFYLVGCLFFLFLSVFFFFLVWLAPICLFLFLFPCLRRQIQINTARG